MNSLTAPLRLSFSLAAPGGLLLLCAAVVLRLESHADPWTTLLQALPYVTVAAGLALGLRFSQTRVALAIVLLAATERILLAQGDNHILFASLAILVPFDLALLGLISERSLLSTQGLLRAGFLASQVVIVVVLQLPEYSGWQRLLDHQFVAPHLTRWTDLPQTSLAAFLLAAGVLSLRFLIRRGPLDGGFFWALLGSAMALHVRWDGTTATTYFATAELVLCAAVVEQSYAMAYRDELTGLPGRRALNERLSELSGSYAIAMVDVDHFKQLNDRHGHDTGDQVLRLIASQLGRVTGGGRAFRYGGEEFAVLFRRQDARSARPHLERLRLSIADSRFALRSSDRPTRKPATPRARSTRQEIRVTVSIGVADASSGRRPEEVIQVADKALFRAKNGGRNCVRA